MKNDVTSNHPGGNVYRSTPRYEKIPAEEDFVAEINRLLRPADDAFVPSPEAFAQPQVFIVGTPRCGSTFAAQLLPSALKIGYVSNLMARFHGAPTVGARLQTMLLQPPRWGVDFVAEHGLTREPESTHEFGYFWRRWFPFEASHQVPAERLEQVDVAGFRRELAGIASVFGAPVVFKNLILGLHIRQLMRWLESPLFVDLVRDRNAVAASILRARRASPGGETSWWSLRPPEYEALKKLSPHEQIATQIISVRSHIENALAQVPMQNQLRVTYEELCKDPRSVVERVRGKLERLGTLAPYRNPPPSGLECRNGSLNATETKVFGVAFGCAEELLASAREDECRTA